MPNATNPTASIRALSQRECAALLARNHVGRLAFAFHDRVDIQPLHYVYEAGWLYGRTSEGAKLATLAHNQWVAFEVDEVRGLLDWASVVVHGSFHRLDPDATGREQLAAGHAAALLRALLPGTLTTDDPVPFRTVLFRIAVGDMTGRLAVSAPPTAESP
jgi:nitroimidazol reductase NimA-like FMN-containing flavoprotein (pyridoxamine 5'-phosphate oxidase superfamily)